ncbi:MAG: cardiolipin synthase [Clostridiales bacterium]|nr:cardiolipin synthase [Clostridiales bacterium]
MKFLKLLFNKTFIIVIACLVQIGIIMLVSLFLSEYLYQFWLISTIISFLLFLAVVNSRDIPETKMLWLAILLPLPFFGIIMYLTFARRRVPKRHVRKISKTLSDINSFLPIPDYDATKQMLSESYGISSYLTAYAKTNGDGNSKTTYFSSGEEWFEDLFSEIQKAEKFVFMEFFIISYGKMWDKLHELLKEKVKQGVEVRIVYDDLGSLGKVAPGYYKKLRKEGIECVKFNTIYPIFSSIYNNRDHRKIVVIDGSVGYTGGANIGDEYINEISRFGHWKDAVVKIEGRGVFELTKLFISTFDGITKRNSDYLKYFPKNVKMYENDEYVHFFGDGPKPFDDENIGENNFVNIISSAQKYVYITTPYLIITHNLFSSLKNAVARGVDVRIVTPAIPDKKIIYYCTRSNYMQLLQAGVKIYEYTPGFIHSKLMVADDKVAFVGTINMDFRSLLHHFECGVDIIGGESVLAIKNDIQNVIDKSEDKKDFKMNKFVSLLCSVLRIFFPLL